MKKFFVCFGRLVFVASICVAVFVFAAYNPSDFVVAYVYLCFLEKAFGVSIPSFFFDDKDGDKNVS